MLPFSYFLTPTSLYLLSPHVAPQYPLVLALILMDHSHHTREEEGDPDQEESE